MSRQLVIGASGQVGEHLLNALKEQGADVIGTCFSHSFEGLCPLDIRQPEAVTDLLMRMSPSVIYLPASLTNVDYCESHTAEAFAINVTGVKNVVDAAERIGARLVYFSSDYIFDGVTGPYSEDAPANPVCEYGRQKLSAEHIVALQASQSLIIRTTVVYGWERQGKNFVQRLITSLEKGESVRVPHDQVGSPTYAPELARAVVELAGQELTGVFHIVGPQRTSRFDFARAVAQCFGLDERLLQPVPTAELGQAAPRPLNAGMQVSKVTAHLSFPLSSYLEGLQKMRQEKRA